MTNNNVEPSDITVEFDGVDTYKTTDFVYITTNKDQYEYINYYMGLTLSPNEEQPIAVSESMPTEAYNFTYRSNIGEDGAMQDGTTEVKVGFEGANVFIQGLWEGLPEAWVVGVVDGDKLTFHLPQYLGEYNDEYLGKYPIYLTAFNESYGSLTDAVTFNYDAATKTFSNHNYPLSIGINKTGYLGLQDYYNGEFTPQALSVGKVDKGETVIVSLYDIQGRKLKGLTKGLNIVKNSDGTVRKVMK